MLKIQRLHKWHFATVDSQACLAGFTDTGKVCIPLYECERVLPKHLIFITLQGMIYQLKSVDPDYERRFPNAKEQFISSICPKDIENTGKNMII
jgi:Fe-S-cluster formation regulator IscX/YfhJ